MPVLTYSEIEAAFQQPAGNSGENAAIPTPATATVVLIHGEELLVKSALGMLTDFLVPTGTRSVSYEPVDGSAGNLSEAVEKVRTYPLLGGRKVVALLEARLFDSKKDPAQLLRKSKDAFESERMQQAAAHLFDFMALTRIDLDDLTDPGREAYLPQEPILAEDNRWLDEVISFCRQTGQTAAAASDSMGMLEKAIERGIPEGNRLILTTEAVDRRKKIYELIKDKGLVIDCSVPKGERKADKKAQEAVLQEIKNSILKKHDKTLQPGVFELLYDMSGFEPRIFTGNLEKLISYTGERREITRADASAVLERTKQDPVFAFTNAVTDRNAAEALFYLASLLHDPQQPIRPEQIVVAILNQVRKLLRIKEFLATAEGSVWVAACAFGQFKAEVLPAILQHDRKLSQRLGEWRQTLAAAADPDGRRKAGGKKAAGRASSDLFIAPQPKNPYPVYQLFRKSERFSPEELRQAVAFLSQADRKIKSGADNKQLILETLIWSICGGEDAIDEDRLHYRTGK
jgi:DNA polymerase-3 subunit delta